MPPTSILIIDPDRSHGHRLANNLELLEFEVIVTGGADEGTAALIQHRPNLVLLDDRVNGLTPFDLLQEFEHQELDTFAIVISENPDHDQCLSWIMSGVFAYLTKPVRMSALKEVIGKGLENQEAYHHVVAMAQELQETNAALQREKAALNEKSQDLLFLHALGSELSATLDARRIVEITSQAMARQMGAELSVFLTDLQPSSRPRLYPSRPLPPELALALGREMLFQLLPKGSTSRPECEIIEPTDHENGITKRQAHKLILPLVAAGHEYGVLGLYFSDESSLAPERRLMMESVALEAAQAMFNALQHERALEQASQDPLTGLLNRRAFQEHLSREFQRHERYGADLSIIMIDLDHFKSVNDRFGHDTGDEVLRTVAGILRNHVRSTDVTGRLGGEEFAALLPNTTQAQAFQLAQRIEDGLKRNTVSIGDLELRQTASQGVTGTDVTRPASADELLRLADQAMYQAKREGRNTIRKTIVRRETKSGKENLYAWN